MLVSPADVVARAKATIKECTVPQAKESLTPETLIIDIREPDEIAAGSPEGATRIVRGFLELRIEQHAPGPEGTLLVMCAGGTRSLFAAHDLIALGYDDVRSVAGGFNAWRGLDSEEYSG